MGQTLSLVLARRNKRMTKKKKKKFTGDVVDISLFSQIIHVRKCVGFVALQCGHKIFV
jgi:hypothetical protein